MYQTRDMGYAAYLICVGYRFINAVKDGGYVYFNFANESGIENEEDEYRIHDASVVARKFNDVLKQLKKLVVELMR